MGNPIGIPNRYLGLGDWALGVEDYPLADQIFAKILQLLREIGDPLMIASALILYGQSALATGKNEQYIKHVKEANELAARSGRMIMSDWFDIWLTYHLGMCALLQSQWLVARGHYMDLLKRTVAGHSFNIGLGLAFSLTGLAKLAVENNQAELATRLFALEEIIYRKIRWVKYPFENQMRQQYLDRLKTILGDEHYTACWKEGAEMSLEKVYTEIMGNQD
jgi:hypothetical protein